jgi:HK97 family phage portal protein
VAAFFMPVVREPQMGWFGRKADAADPRSVLPFYASGQDSDPLPRSYSARVQEVYVDNPVGQRAVRLVAGAAGALAIYAAEGREDAASLVRQAGLIEGIAAQVMLHGNAFVHVVATAKGQPGELFCLRPERVTVETDARGWPTAYLYKVRSQISRFAVRDALARTQVIHVKALNPGDDHLGLGCLDAAIAAASVHNRATRWNKALLDNAARPSGALTFEPGDGSTLTETQFRRLRAEMDDSFSGSGNAGRPLLLEGGLKWQPLSLTPADMDFIRLKEAAARDVALAFGVPPVLLGLPGDSTYANLREAGRALYRQTVMPLTQRIIDGLANGLSDWFGPVRLAIDVDQVSELAEDRERLWQQVGAATFLSEGEKREMLGFKSERDQ